MSEKKSARSPSPCWLVVFIAAHFMFVPFQTLNAQENSPAALELDLPEHAIYRFGKYGDCPKGNGVYRLQFSPDGKLLASRSRQNIVSIFDVKNKKQLCEVEGHDNNWVETIDFSPDSKFFVTAAGSGENVKVWSTQTGKLEGEIKTDSTAAYFDSTGSRINVLGETHVEVYSWPGGRMETQRKWKGDNETRVAMSKDGRMVVSYRTLNRQIYQTQILDLETKSKVTLDGPTSIPKSVIISENQLWVSAAYHRDSKIRLWDLRDPHQKKYTLTKHTETVQSISFSSDNRFLVSSGWDEQVNVWDLLTRQPVGTFEGHSDHVNATACSPLDLVFASGASGQADCSTILWDMDALVVPMTDKPVVNDFEEIWTGLGLNSLERSLAATSQFIQGGDEFLDLMQKKFGDVLGQHTTGNVAELIQLLKSPRFAVRENATAELMKIRSQVDAELRAAFEEQRSPEIRYRLTLILKQKVKRPTANLVDLRRWHRIVFALERIATDRTQMILKQIANGHEDVDIAKDAKDSLGRNKLRKAIGAG